MEPMGPLVALFLASLLFTGALDYIVTDNAMGTPGGTWFEKEMGLNYTKQMLYKATLTMETMKDRVAHTISDSIHLNADYGTGITDKVKTEVFGVLYHERAHMWQWDGKGDANRGFIKGVEDYIRLKAGYAPSDWAKAGEGERWDEGYSVTVRFLEYCNWLRDRFAVELRR